MSGDNSNFIIGLISSIALVVGLIASLISIYKDRLEISNLHPEIKKQKGDKKESSLASKKKIHRSPTNIGLIVDVLFFLIFSVSSVSAIIDFLNNRVPTIAIVSAQFFILIYSFIILSDSREPISAHTLFSKNEQRFFTLLSWVGLLIALVSFLSFGMIRLIGIFTYAYENLFSDLFSIGANLALVPLIVFSIASLDRIIKHITYISISQERS